MALTNSMPWPILGSIAKKPGGRIWFMSITLLDQPISAMAQPGIYLTTCNFMHWRHSFCYFCYSKQPNWVPRFLKAKAFLFQLPNCRISSLNRTYIRFYGWNSSYYCCAQISSYDYGRNAYWWVSKDIIILTTINFDRCLERLRTLVNGQAIICDWSIWHHGLVFLLTWLVCYLDICGKNDCAGSKWTK